MKTILIILTAVLVIGTSCKKDTGPSCKPILTKKIEESRNGFRYLITTSDGTAEVDSTFYVTKNLGDTLCRTR